MSVIKDKRTIALQKKTDDSMQICIACNKLQPSSKTSCECGHVLREALTLREENTSRKRRAPYRPNSISSEWICVKEKAELKIALKKARHSDNTVIQANDKNNNTRQIIQNPSQPNSTILLNKHNGRTKKHGNAGRKKTKTTINNNGGSLLIHQESDGGLKKEDSEKQRRYRELLDIIENSYQNVYFNRCKSYKKAKLSDFNFEFDFSLFDSHSPYYPTALQDINTKINKTNSFWNKIM